MIPTKTLLLIAIVVAASAGCTSSRLRSSVLKQAGTVTELQYEQVLSNLAMVKINPSALPSQVIIRDGSSQIQDLGSATATLFLDSRNNTPPNLAGSRTVVQQWGVRPVSDDNELKIIRMAYRRAVGIPVSLQSDFDFTNDLAHELKKQLAQPENPDIQLEDQPIRNLLSFASRSTRDDEDPWGFLDSATSDDDEPPAPAATPRDDVSKTSFVPPQDPPAAGQPPAKLPTNPARPQSGRNGERDLLLKSQLLDYKIEERRRLENATRQESSAPAPGQSPGPFALPGLPRSGGQGATTAAPGLTAPSTRPEAAPPAPPADSPTLQPLPMPPPPPPPGEIPAPPANPTLRGEVDKLMNLVASAHDHPDLLTAGEVGRVLDSIQLLLKQAPLPSEGTLTKLEQLLSDAEDLPDPIRGKIEKMVSQINKLVQAAEEKRRKFTATRRIRNKLVEGLAKTSLIDDNTLSTTDENIITRSEFDGPAGLIGIEPGVVKVDPPGYVINASGERQVVPGPEMVDDHLLVTAAAKEIRRQVKQVEDDLLKIGTDCRWIHFGPKVPKGACYSGRYGTLYAWVMADGLDPLAELTLKVINFSDLIKESSVVTSPGGPRYAPTPSLRSGRGWLSVLPVEWRSAG